MSAQAGAVIEAVNEIRLVGRVSGAPEERVLPSGDSVWTFRIVVGRPPGDARGRVSVDTFDCAVWQGRLRRSVAAWSPDDMVEVEGSLRRRFYRGAAGQVSRVEVVVAKGRVIRRAATS